MRRASGMYRTPPTPGFVGGYNWSGVVAGLALLLLANITATQFIAARLRYQPALGTPLATVHQVRLYQPFAWATWLLHHGSSQHPQIRMTLLSGALIIVIGSAAAIAGVYGLNIRRARRLSEDAEDLHGSARWATPEEVESTGLIAATQGVYVGGWCHPGSNHLNYLRHNGPEHVLAFAPTRSGKGVGLVIPTLLAWSESVVVYDIKGENWAKTAGFRQQQGHLCFKFSPIEIGNGSRFNLLAELRMGTLRDVSDAQNIAEMLIKTGADTSHDPYWQIAAASLTTGMILHACYAAAREGRVACLTDVAGIFSVPGQRFEDTLAELENYPHDPTHKHDWRTRDGERTTTHPVVREKVREMLNKEEKDFSGVLSTARAAFSLFSDPLVSRNTSASDFTVDDLVNHERPISLYLVVPNSDRMRLRPLIGLIFTIIVNRLTERMDYEGSAQRRNRHRLLLMIDEFPSLTGMKVFADALSYMAGYGLKAYLITQDIRQIIDEYGPNESIVSNCHIRVAYAPNQVETAELLSKMTGTATVQRATFNFSGSRLAPIADQMSASVELIERPLMTPDEIMRLKAPKKTGSGPSERITAPGDMLIFVSGQNPIHGTQMLYFFDPVLQKRAAIAPPTTFPAIEAGRVITQKPMDRTANVISKPEEPEDSDERLTVVERAFIETLTGKRVPRDTTHRDLEHGFLEQLTVDQEEN